MAGFCRKLATLGCCALVALVWNSIASPLSAQVVPGAQQAGLVQQIGGVSVDAAGVLKNVDPKDRKDLAELRAKALNAVPLPLQGATELRMVSLRKLQETIAEHAKQKQPLPDEVQVLAGLQRVNYLFVDEANKDIIIAGPAEGWKINAQGSVVGITTNRPVLLLDDLLVMLRTIDAARNGGVSCSIDPTPESVQKAQQFISTLKPGNNAQAAAKELENVMGMQTVSVTGVPGDSHFAHVLVAADYRMKRLGMNFDESKIKGFPSYLQMAGARESMFPRWWLAPNYEPLGKAADGLAWEIRGGGVKCLTAEDQRSADGKRTATAQGGSSAKKWADLMTQKYEELCVVEPVFAELQNCMDLAVVAALIQQERLCDRLDLPLTTLLDEQAVPRVSYNVPKQVPTIGSTVKKGNNWVISASGGVLFQPWELVQTSKPNTKATEVQAKALAARKASWWWN